VQVEVARTAVVLDTNVLVGAFCPDDQHHEYCRLIFDMDDQFLVPIPVLVEAWGMLVGKLRRWDYGTNLLNWIVNPGSNVVVLHDPKEVQEIDSLIREVHVDCVDALLAYLAHSLSEKCRLKPPIRVATLDTSDLLKCRIARTLRLILVDLRTLDEF
jgi:predicted nucleic acid-binding protein